MRTWFDHRRIEPDSFRHSSDRAEITFRVDFSVAAEASAFAQAFGGRLIGSDNREPADRLRQSGACRATPSVIPPSW